MSTVLSVLMSTPLHSTISLVCHFDKMKKIATSVLIMPTTLLLTVAPNASRPSTTAPCIRTRAVLNAQTATTTAKTERHVSSSVDNSTWLVNAKNAPILRSTLWLMVTATSKSATATSTNSNTAQSARMNSPPSSIDSPALICEPVLKHALMATTVST